MENKSRVLEILALTVATIAIFISIWQVRESQEHNKLSVQPFLSIWHQAQHMDDTGWTMYNAGIGPALIINSRIKYKDEYYSKKGVSQEAWGQIKIKLQRESQVFSNVKVDGLTCGDVLPAKENINFLNDDQLKEPERDYIYENINIEVCYCSFHGKCFHAAPTESDKVKLSSPDFCPEYVDVNKLMREKSSYCERENG